MKKNSAVLMGLLLLASAGFVFADNATPVAGKPAVKSVKAKGGVKKGVKKGTKAKVSGQKVSSKMEGGEMQGGEMQK